MPPELNSPAEWLALATVVVTMAVIAHYLWGIGK